MYGLCTRPDVSVLCRCLGGEGPEAAQRGCGGILVDALGLDPSGRKVVQVRVLSSPPKSISYNVDFRPKIFYHNLAIN